MITVDSEGSFEMAIDGKRITDAKRAIEKLIDELGEASKDRLYSYAAFIPNNDSFMQSLALGLVDNWDDVEKTEAHSTIIREYIVRAVADKLTEASLRKDYIVVRKELPKTAAYIKLADLGDGVERFLTAALWIETIKPKVILWDDLEAALHPQMVDVILEWLANGEWQIVASTHSIDVLEAFANADIKDGKVIQLWKSSDDVLDWKGLTVDELNELLESGMDARKIFRW